MVLGKDPYHCCVTRADLFFAEGRLSIVTCDEEGIIRIYAYDPHGMDAPALAPSVGPN